VVRRLARSLGFVLRIYDLRIFDLRIFDPFDLGATR
jgi:hypothetical protein